MDPEPNEETNVSDSASPRGPAAEVPASGGAQASSAGGEEPTPAAAVEAPARKRSPRSRPKAGTHPNNVRKLRQRAMMSKAELARRAGVSPLTIDRVEAGCPCRMDTKRKILEALGLQPVAATEVFPEIDLG